MTNLPASTPVNRNAAAVASDLIPPLDIVCILLAAAMSTAVWTGWVAADAVLVNDFAQAPWIAAVLAPFVLYDRNFGAKVSRGGVRAFVRPFTLRFLVFSGVVLALGAVTQTLGHFPLGWLVVWFVTSLALTVLARTLIAHVVRSLQRRGAITDVIAVVGAGPVADRLVNALRRDRPDTVELLGIFDDRTERSPAGCIEPVGNLAQLVELGKTRKIDWILLALPPTAETRLHAIVQRLMALAVPIGLCPQHVGSSLPCSVVDYAADTVPVTLLADRPIKRWNAVLKSAEDFLPRWMITLALLPQAAIAAFSRRTPRQAPEYVLRFDNYDLDRFTGIAASFGRDRCGYVVTPNADHVIRLHENAAFRALYATADYVLLDSRFLSHLLRIATGRKLPVCTGSDLTARLLADVVAPGDRLVLIGGSDEQARQLRERYGLLRLAHFNPPMGFIRDPDAVETCLQFIEAQSPFRFCLLAVGSPQQESIAQRLKARGIARGLTLCIGASINFLTGAERRAPLWMQRAGMEWLFRLALAPGRMASRYLVRGPRVLGALRHASIVLNEPPPHAHPLASVPRSTTVRASAVPSPAQSGRRATESGESRLSAAS